MPYVRTGNPPGRPRKQGPVVEPIVEQLSEPKRLERAREGFRRVGFDPASVLHRPPRVGKRRKTEVGRRPVLHPNVISKSE